MLGPASCQLPAAGGPALPNHSARLPAAAVGLSGLAGDKELRLVELGARVMVGDSALPGEALATEMSPPGITGLRNGKGSVCLHFPPQRVLQALR